jgi:hypothetical protein
MDDEAKLGWWDQELFRKFREMIRDGRAVSIPEDVRKVVK